MTVSGGAQVQGVDPLAEHSASWLLRWARTQLDRESQGAELGPPPAGVRAAPPVTVILTIHSGRDSLGFSGQGGGLLEALMSAVGQALAATITAKRLQIDIIDGEATPLARPARTARCPIAWGERRGCV